MSTEPSLTQNFEGEEDKEAEIRDLEIKLAKMKLDMAQQKKASQKVSSPLPKASPKAVVSHQTTPAPSLSLEIDTPEKSTMSGELERVRTSPEGVMAVENPYLTALGFIQNLPDGECKSAMMALCEASMVSPQVWSITFMMFSVCHQPFPRKAWISRLPDLFVSWSIKKIKRGIYIYIYSSNTSP